MDKYREVLAKSAVMAENNDCSVIALAIVTGLEYSKVHRIFELLGRKRGCATYRDVSELAMNVLGIEYKKFDPTIPGHCRFTPKTIGHRYPVGRYVCTTARHMFALVDGQVQDWTQGRKHRITDMYAIKSINGICPITGDRVS